MKQPSVLWSFFSLLKKKTPKHPEWSFFFLFEKKKLQIFSRTSISGVFFFPLEKKNSKLLKESSISGVFFFAQEKKNSTFQFRVRVKWGRMNSEKKNSAHHVPPHCTQEAPLRRPPYFRPKVSKGVSCEKNFRMFSPKNIFKLFRIGHSCVWFSILM